MFELYFYLGVVLNYQHFSEWNVFIRGWLGGYTPISLQKMWTCTARIYAHAAMAGGTARAALVKSAPYILWKTGLVAGRDLPQCAKPRCSPCYRSWAKRKRFIQKKTLVVINDPLLSYMITYITKKIFDITCLYQHLIITSGNMKVFILRASSLETD